MLFRYLLAASLGYAASAADLGIPLERIVGAIIALVIIRCSARIIAALARSPLDDVESPLNCVRVRTRWRNLGLWPPSGDSDYASACSALANRVGDLAGVGATTAVLDVGCGAGESLRLWASRGARLVVGADAAPPAGSDARVVRCDAATVGSLRGGAAPSVPFDAVVCVDAAYHFAPHRLAFFEGAHAALADGGRLALADVVAGGGEGSRSRACRLARRVVSLLMRVPAPNLCEAGAYEKSLRAAGFEQVELEVVTERVVGGFERFATAHAASFGRPPDWDGWSWSSVGNAGRAIGWAFRAARLDYVLVSARKPAACERSSDGSRASETEDDAKGGEAREGAGRRGRIKLMNEYMCELPLWQEGEGQVSEEMLLEELRLSRRLEKGLRALATRFNNHFQHDRGWDDEDRARRHADHARSMHRRLKRELGPAWDVVLDLWECNQIRQYQ